MKVQSRVPAKLGSGLCTLVLFISQSGLLLSAQGIHTSIVQLPLPGHWEERLEWVAHLNVQEKSAFYERDYGTVLYISRSESRIPEAMLNGMIEQFRQIEPLPTPHLGFARFLSIAVFRLPASYVKQAGRALDSGAHPPRLWEIVDTEGDAHWFYVSQLTPGFLRAESSDPVALSVGEEYARMELTRGERRRTNGGEALVFEMETHNPAGEKAASRFQMPEQITDQRIRYGWLDFAPDGFAGSKPMLSIVFATPVNSGLDSDVLLRHLEESPQE